jgi:hypothetical protein
MISPLNPNHGLILVSDIEEALIALGCTKVGHGIKQACKWRAPNGRHFHAPNPNVYKMVPVDTLGTTIQRATIVMRLPAPHA